MLQLVECRYAQCQFHTCTRFVHAWFIHMYGDYTPTCTCIEIFISWIYIQVLDLGRLIYTAYKSISCSFIYTDSIVLAGAHANMCVLWGLSILCTDSMCT